MVKRLVVAITGASGAIIGVKMLEALRETEFESHLIISKWGRQTLEVETNFSLEQVSQLADVYYNSSDMGASVSSGSFLTSGMVIVPCSMRTLAAVAGGIGDTLIHRAADVVIKEQKKLVLMPREMPFSVIHLDNMLKLSKIGITIMPPMIAFYNSPTDIDDLLNHIVARALDQFGIENDFTRRWQGKGAKI